LAVLVFGLAVRSQPVDVVLQDVTTPDFLE
jgi:hypothetical protein